MRRIVRNPLMVAGCLVASLAAQTPVDKVPVSWGQALPASCIQGEVFFVTTAAAGENLYGCTSGNIWAVQGGGSGGGAGALTVESSGTVVGSRTVTNFIPGTGLFNVISDDGTKINVQQTVDTAVLLTRAANQSGQTLLCVSNGGSSSSYSCALSPTLASYQRGMIVNWIPDVDGAGGATTLNVDLLGPLAVKLADGSLDPVAGDLTAGKMYSLWFDGGSFRMIGPVQPGGSAGMRPACSSTTRGRIWTIFAAAGTKDEVAVCAKDSANAYAWRVLY